MGMTTRLEENIREGLIFKPRSYGGDVYFKAVKRGGYMLINIVCYIYMAPTV